MRPSFNLLAVAAALGIFAASCQPEPSGTLPALGESPAVEGTAIAPDGAVTSGGAEPATPASLGAANGAADDGAAAAAGGMTAVAQTPVAAVDASFTAPLTATLRFTAPEEGATVTSPVSVCLEAAGISIEPSGPVRPNAGHHHVILDPTPEDLQSVFSGGAAIPKDERRLHIGDGTGCMTVTMAPGSHILIGVVADGAHIPLKPPVFSQLNLVVK